MYLIAVKETKLAIKKDPVCRDQKLSGFYIRGLVPHKVLICIPRLAHYSLFVKLFSLAVLFCKQFTVPVFDMDASFAVIVDQIHLFADF